MGRQALILGALVAPAPFAVDMFLPALPQISGELAASPRATQLTLTAYFLAFALAHLVYGPWSDARGRLTALRWGAAIFVIGSALATVAHSIEMLIAARIVQASGAAALTVLPRAMIRDRFTGIEATRLTALLMLILSVSPLLAPLAGSLLMMVGDWRWIFATLTLGGLSTLVLLERSVTETLPHIERYPVSAPVLWKGMRRLARERTFVGMTALASFGLANFFVFVAIAPYAYAARYGLGHVGVSVALAFNGVGFFAAAQAAAPLAARHGSNRTMLWGAAGFGLTIAATALAEALTPLALGPLVALLALANACLGLTVPTALCRALDPHGPIAGLAASVAGAVQMAVTGLLILGAGLALDPDIGGLLTAALGCALLVVVTASAVLRPETGRRGYVEGFRV